MPKARNRPLVHLLAFREGDPLGHRIVKGYVIQSLDAAHIFPELGTSDGESRQGNHLFRWRQEVSITPNFSFRRVEVKIFAEDQPDYVLARQVSYVSRIEDK